MEVHHHSHSHGKKTWKKYFWEFLMLFLAVFCGFLAEYVLEHKIEKEKGKEFLRSYYEDLKSDTARITTNIEFDSDKLEGMAGLTDCYAFISKNPVATSCLLDIVKATAVNRPFLMTERTLSQLANAGGFRLLNKEDADMILDFQKIFADFQDFQHTVYQQSQDQVRSTWNSVVNFTAYSQMFPVKDEKLVFNFPNEIVTEPILFSGDKTIVNRFFNELMLYYRVTINHLRQLRELKQKQAELLAYFTEKYNFR
jgi:hypothetical protein